ncbi:MAG: pyridoxamine 5'-phosphate oxidase family protein [Thaumarchaeota archaeon]|jgi:nitroimidazol reductase NimA-like FMN-containing flavoprotein (pyridoxamine 5'-phosphate oxidase superfamily)|nr:pyridoxamine 5'-phosphate oxidase family protein [Nitrososphaerota archaeon]MBT3743141.1 pyridoxamine 5'-phosphate oxidase family protein [Nitrososphaerota archaeon]MBT4056933.1 pyridoxamine 5'-phosphate oxidase family protein [Nitrososphaerota archaeon]MBT4176056.1 pyridoxamine 5'-phosphate oxidase family protein [Nitrososphaerota archaeon]MBT4509369.1 pyridoxamine 5'-phosphate oxidase family protein [Nitrososphaerota archaeon]
MQLVGKLIIKSKDKIIKFLSEESTGRISSIDKEGFPQIIPMNFVFLDNSVYMHSHIRGEKIENIKRNSKVGFEVDRNLEFLPSYFSDPDDASLADTLYISVVIKGEAVLVEDRKEKVLALNGLMEKYQPEGQYTPMREDMDVLDATAVIKVTSKKMNGKYKIGQNMSKEEKIELATKILDKNSKTAKETVKIMGFVMKNDKLVMKEDVEW